MNIFKKKIQLNQKNLSIFFTCYNEIAAVNFAIDNLYKVYPNIRCMLISDGGRDFSNLDKQYNGLFSCQFHDSRSFTRFVNSRNFKTIFYQNHIINSIIEYLERIRLAFFYGGRDYLLIMEPDVLIRGLLEIPVDAKITGSRVNEFHYPRLDKLLNNFKKSIKINRYGAVPTIIEKNSFMEIHSYFISNSSQLRSLSDSCEILLNTDVLLPVLFAAFGYPEIFNPQIVEVYREPNWRNDSRPLVHQFRELYPTNEQEKSSLRIGQV